jgi:hypothetical protein
MENSDNGSQTDVLQLMDYPLGHLEAPQKNLFKAKSPLSLAVEETWQKLDRYYNATDKSSVYVTAVIIDPRMKLSYFQRKWPHNKVWVLAAQRATEKRYNEYIDKYSESVTLVTNSSESQTSDIFDMFKFGASSQQVFGSKDELADYLSLHLVTQGTDLVKWRIEYSTRFPILSRLALDILAIPATSAEAERAFSGYC